MGKLLIGIVLPPLLYAASATLIVLLREAWGFSSELLLFAAAAVSIAVGFGFVWSALRRWALLVGILYFPVMCAALVYLSAVLGIILLGEGHRRFLSIANTGRRSVQLLSDRVCTLTAPFVLSTIHDRRT